MSDFKKVCAQNSSVPAPPMADEEKAALEERLAQTQQALQKAASFGKQFAEDNQALREQVAQLQAQLEAAESGAHSNGGSDVDSRRKLESLAKDHEETIQRAAGLESTCKELITRLESKESEVASLESRVLEYSRRNEEIESQNRSLMQKLKQSSAMADQAMTLNEDMEALRAKLSEAVAKETTQNRLVSSLEERLAQYQSQYEDSHLKTASENESLLKQVEKLTSEVASKNARLQRLESLQTTTDELQAQSNELLETITSLKEENGLLQRQIEVKDTVIAQQKARALSLMSNSSASSDTVVASPSRKANLGSLLTTATPTHSRQPSGGAVPAQTPTPPPTAPVNDQSSQEAQLMLKQQQDQLNTMQAQLEARERDMAAQQRQLMEALTKINLNIVATRPKPPGTCVVLLGNLPEEVIYDPDIMESMQSLVGGVEIKSFRWVSKDGEFLGFGFLEFLSTADADKAVGRNGRLYLNRQISIAYATREEFEAGKPSKG